MDYAYRFGDPATLYLNVTNRCANRCVFCVTRFADGLGTGRLRGGPEPDLDSLLAAAEDLATVDEVVFCGFGEPTYRLDLVLAASPVFRRAGCRVRLNTNGHGSAIAGRDVLSELGEVLDVLSVSLNAPSCERYLELCRPRPELAGLADPSEVWEATVDLLARAPAFVPEVRASVVAHALGPGEVERCRVLARRLGCERFVVR